MNNYARSISSSVFGILLITSGNPVIAEDKADASPVIATVNGAEITAADRDLVSQQLIARGQQADEARITEELINLELMQQEAVKRKLDQSADVLAQLDMLRTRVLANAAITAIGDDIVLTDEEINAEYEQQVAKLDLQEFKASHILLEDEASAKAVIEELGKGADFAELAKEKSTGPSGPNGGDLGWFNAKSMVPEFSAAVAAMQPGDVSSEPVKTQFGYHVIKLMETRKSEAPQMDQVRGEIERILRQGKLAKKIDELRAAASIDMVEAKEAAE